MKEINSYHSCLTFCLEGKEIGELYLLVMKVGSRKVEDIKLGAPKLNI